MTPDTHTRLKEIRDRVEKATSGPWRTVAGYERVNMCGIYDKNDDTVVAEYFPYENSGVVITDAEFIAHSREDVPFLLDLIDDYQKMWEVTSKRVFPGDADSGDALIQVFREQKDLIEKQQRALGFAKRALEKSSCIGIRRGDQIIGHSCDLCDAVNAIEDLLK